MWATEDVYPECLVYPMALVCPVTERNITLRGSKCDPATLLNDDDFIYLGYAVTSDSEFGAFVAAYLARISSNERFNGDIPVSAGCGTAGSNMIYRLRNCLDKLFTNNSEDEKSVSSRVPLLIERPGTHSASEPLNVLYLDGHVEAHICPGEFPYSQSVLDGLRKIDALK